MNWNYKYFWKVLPAVLILTSTLYSKDITYSFTGEMYFPDNIVQDIVTNSSKEKYSIEENVQISIREILDMYSNAGFPLCTIQVKELQVDTAPVECLIEINSGEYVRISFIELNGNAICDKEFLVRETRLKVGLGFIEEEVIAAMNYLHKTELFYMKPVYSIVRKDGKVGLMINLSEKKYFKGMFLGGMNNSDSGSDFTGTGELLAENIFGTNRKAGVKWLKKNDSDEKVHLMYREPFIFSYPISNKLIFEQENIERSYLKRKYEILTELAIDPESDIFVSYSNESIYPDSSNTTIASDIKIDRYEGGLKYSTLYGSSLIPAEAGFSIYGSVSSINTNFEGRDSSNTAIQLNFELKKIFSINKRIFYTINNEYSQVFSSEQIDSFSKIIFGGAYGLRGYRDESFISDMKLISESEFVFTPVDDLGFGFFIDIAAFNPNFEKLRKIEEIKINYGYGIVLTYFKNSNEIQFTIGIPGEAGFSDSMVHVKYAYRF